MELEEDLEEVMLVPVFNNNVDHYGELLAKALNDEVMWEYKRKEFVEAQENKVKVHY